MPSGPASLVFFVAACLRMCHPYFFHGRSSHQPMLACTDVFASAPGSRAAQQSRFGRPRRDRAYAFGVTLVLRSGSLGLPKAYVEQLEPRTAHWERRTKHGRTSGRKRRSGTLRTPTAFDFNDASEPELRFSSHPSGRGVGTLTCPAGIRLIGDP